MLDGCPLGTGDVRGGGGGAGVPSQPAHTSAALRRFAEARAQSEAGAAAQGDRGRPPVPGAVRAVALPSHRCALFLHLLRLRLLTFVAYLLSVHQYLLCLSLGPMLSTLLLQLRFLTCVICLLCFIFEDYHPFCVSNAWAHALSLACMLSAVLHLCNPGTCVKVAVMHCMLCSKLY